MIIFHIKMVSYLSLFQFSQKSLCILLKVVVILIGYTICCFIVPGPCDPDDLLDGVIFGAKYLGSTQIKSDRNPSTNARMTQAQEAVDRIKVCSEIIL